MRGDEGLGHAPVQTAPLGGARLAVGHVPQPVVGEVVRVRPLLADDALPPELVEGARDHLFVAHQAHEDVQVEGAPDHGRGRGRLPGVVRELGQAAGDHRVRAGRKPGDSLLRDARRRLAPALGPHRLHDEEGIALGLPVEPGGRVRVEDPVPDLGGQLRRLRRVQRLEGDLGELRCAPQVPEERRERVRGVELLRTRGPEDEQARLGIEPGQEMEPLEGLAVAPLQVVDEEQQRRRSRERRPGQALEEAQPVAELRHGRGPRQARPGGQQLGQDPRDLDAPHVLETGEVRREGVAAQPFAHGGEGEPAFRGVGARLRRGHSLALGPGQQLLRQPRLADAGVARHEREGGPSLDGPLPGLAQPRPLGLPAHEGCGRGGPLALAGGRLGAGLGVADPLVGADGLRARLRGQLAAERVGALAIRLERRHPIAGQRQQPHEPAVRLLVEGVVLQPVPDAGDGARVLALLLEQAHERGHGVLAPARETLPLRSDPVVVAAREQGPLTQVHRPLQAGAAPRRVSRPAGRLGLGDRTVEEGDVEAEGGVRGPLHAVRVGPEVAVGVGQGLPQLMEELPQVVAGVRLRGVRPEGEGEVRPRLRRVRVEEQIGEERLQPRGRGAVDGPAVDGQAELTEETDLERSRHLNPPSPSRGASRHSSPLVTHGLELHGASLPRPACRSRSAARRPAQVDRPSVTGFAAQRYHRRGAGVSPPAASPGSPGPGEGHARRAILAGKERSRARDALPDRAARRRRRR